MRCARSPRRRLGRGAGLCALAIVAASCRHPPDLPRKQTLARLPAEFMQGSFAVSTDFEHAAFQEQGTGRVRMVVDGTAGAPWQRATTRSFAPGTGRLFYWAHGLAPAGAAGAFFLVAGTTPYAVGPSRHEYLVFSRDGGRWAVLATVPEGAAPPPDDGRVLVLADGVERGRWADAAVPAFSPDGTRLVWLVADPPGGASGRRRLLVDGAERRAFTPAPGRCIPPVETAGPGPRLPARECTMVLADGTDVTLVRDGEGYGLFRGAERVASYAVSLGVAVSDGPVLEVQDPECLSVPAIASGSLVAAAKAPVLLWWARAPGGPPEAWRVVRDGTPVDDLPCVRPWEPQPPLVSDDGHSWAYACVTRVPVTGQQVVVVTPRGRYGPYREVWGLAMSDDGRRVAYGASTGDDPMASSWQVHVDGVPYPPRYYAVWRPRFDPSGRHVAWEGIPAVRSRPVLALDGRDLVRFDELVDGPAYLAPGWVSWAVRRGRRLARINFPLQTAR